MALEIIGAGFGRTGTTSLRVALEHLGFVKCHHMMSLQEQRGLAKAWHDVALKGARNWDEIFEGFRATVDWPSTAYYKELMAHYPDAKVLLTVRDPDAWYQSAAETIFAVDRHIPGWLRWLPQVATVTEMVRAVIWLGELQGRFEDPPAAKEIFRRHLEEVKATVAPERLLVFHVAEGWEPLCEFLGVPVPQDRPFPHVNERASMKRFMRVLWIVGKLPYFLVAAGLIWLAAGFFL